ncbi:TetR/AcrR family transcriptional regulator [Curtobacterium aetherium]|uniref:Uncharacterized protein n=1 Tax=Curtobacterium aetherium TaxID=2841594 RepID=A0ACD1E2N6_9MICO|nr:hypothetical protein [Curtobacterium sp. L6-1]QWS33185.1 hypothetical protein KM842_13175 [Curtobacterium sp. L6-1]
MPDSDLRNRIIPAAIEAFRRSDFHAVGPAEVAALAEVSDAEVSDAYPVWDLLVVAVMNRWDNGDRKYLWPIAEQHGAAAYLRARLESGLADPALVRIRIATLSAASAPTHPAAGWFRTQYVRAFEDITLALVRDVVAGREPHGTSPRHAAEQLVALYEGLQLQSQLRDGSDLLAGWDRAVARMRAGWGAVALV